MASLNRASGFVSASSAARNCPGSIVDEVDFLEFEGNPAEERAACDTCLNSADARE